MTQENNRFNSTKENSTLVKNQNDSQQISPLPWFNHDFDDSYIVADSSKVPQEICYLQHLADEAVEPQQKANAHYIVKACNEYPQLKKRVEELEDNLGVITRVAENTRINPNWYPEKTFKAVIDGAKKLLTTNSEVE